jgi:hypothetical protein
MKKIVWTDDLLNQLPSSKEEAILVNSKYFFDKKKCSVGHIGPKLIIGRCFYCKREETKILAEKRRRKNGQKKILPIEPNIRHKNLLTTGKERFVKTINGKRNRKQIEVICDCGEKFWTRNLQEIGSCRKCGYKLSGKKHTKHGKSHDLLYQIFHSAKKRAKKDNVIFTLNLEDLVFQKFCPVFNVELDWTVRKSLDKNRTPRFNAPSLDRVNPNKGYTKENVQIISLRANFLKSDGSDLEHIQIAKYLRKKGL